MRAVLLLLLLAPAAAAEPLVLQVDGVPEPATGPVTITGSVEVPDGAMTNTWVEIVHQEATFRFPWRAEAQHDGMGQTTHSWNTTWNTTLVPDGQHTLHVQAHSGNGRSSESHVMQIRTENGNWAQIVQANVSYTDIGITGVRVEFRFVVEAGFTPVSAQLLRDEARSMPTNTTVVPLGEDRYSVVTHWRGQRPPPGDPPDTFEMGLELSRSDGSSLDLRSAGVPAGSVEVTIEAWQEPEWRIQYGPERNATALAPDRMLPPEVAIAAGGGAVVLAFVATVSTEAGRLGLVGLFSRIHGPRVLDHATRARITQTVGQRPGLRFRELKKAADLATGTLVHHLGVLEREGLVRRKRDGGRVLIYPGGAAPSGAELHPLAFRLWGEMSRDPRLNMAACARGWGVSRQALHHHLQRLRALGVVADGGPPWKVRAPNGYCRRCHWLGGHRRCTRCGSPL